MPLNSEKGIQNLKNIKKNILSFFINQDERNAHISSNLVYCSVKCLFCLKISYIDGPGSATIK